jgi:polyhydroxyalkanoate synthase
LIGFDVRQLLGVTARWLGSVSVQPGLMLRHGARVGGELGRVAVGRSQVAPPKGDRRFSDPAWSENPLYRRLMQTYLLLAEAVHWLIDEAGLGDLNTRRTHFAASILTDSLAPTNALVTNPAAIKRAFDTAGISLFRGVAHILDDIRNNGGMPSMVDRRPFELGRNVAATAGAVVHREESFELIQYQPSTEGVCERPVVLIPPQINKFYAMDLAPGRSLTEFALSQGISFFTISWRNPTQAQRDWNLDTYVQACISAIDVAPEITGSDCVNLMGVCAGGVTMSLALGHLGAIRSEVVNSATFIVCMLDTEARSI